MSITSCRECGGQVSDQARVCPACGVSSPTLTAVRQAERRRAWRLTGVGVLILAMLAGGLVYRHHRQQQQDEQRVCDYRSALGAPC